MWLLIDFNILHTNLSEHLNFLEFVAITNGALLIISIYSATYKNLGDKVLAWGYSNVLRFVLLIVLSLVIFVIAYALLMSVHFQINQVSELVTSVIGSINNTYFLPLVFFFVLVSILMFFISNLERRSGSVIRLLSQSMGQTIKPNLVNRGFMFIDLNDATSLAEYLSSEKYANLLRDCFRMLNELVDVSPFEIYQYVGDEAVIVWDTKTPKASVKAVQLFDDFKAYLIENESAFAKAYQMQPKFKCAIHSGQVVRSEIGNQVRHLVFHGDVLNTTSRLLSYCHDVQTDCIISNAALENKDAIASKFQLEAITANNLKGKTISVKAHKILAKKTANSTIITTEIANIFLPTKVTNSHNLKLYGTEY